jgi:hypothetical protein
MRPVGLTQPRGKGLAIVHRCVVCGTSRVNRIAAGTDAADDVDVLAALPPAPWAGHSRRR